MRSVTVGTTMMTVCRHIAVGLAVLLLVSGCVSRGDSNAENPVVIRVDDRMLTLAHPEKKRGMILDNLREQDWLSRTARRKAVSIERTRVRLEGVLGRAPREDEIAAVQLERMKWSLRHAYDNVPFYRAKFDEAGVHPDDLHHLDIADAAVVDLHHHVVAAVAVAEVAPFLVGEVELAAALGAPLGEERASAGELADAIVPGVRHVDVPTPIHGNVDRATKLPISATPTDRKSVV